MGINVVGGNMFYSAKPFGVIEGVDFGFTGEVGNPPQHDPRHSI
jgi:acetylglutamate kinase